MEVTRRRGRRHKKLLDDLEDMRGYSHLKKEVLDRTMWRNRFWRSVGPVVRQNTEWMKSKKFEFCGRNFFSHKHHNNPGPSVQYAVICSLCEILGNPMDGACSTQ